MKKNTILVSLFSLLIFSCSSDDIPTDPGKEPGGGDETEKVTLSMVDKNATAETKALYSQLWAIQSKGFIFGHHDDLMYGRTWYNVQGNSDTKDVCGDYPGVYSMDFAEVMDSRYAGNQENAIRKRCILEARSRGEVILGCCHLNNPLTEDLSAEYPKGTAWDNTKAVDKILQEGSEVNIKFKTWLDRLAAFVLELKDEQGKPIPVIFRPFHEHTQAWSWWGQSGTNEKEFIALWQFTVKYLRDTKGVHQFIYAISPQMDSPKREDDFYYRWPGDDYVDFIGMDCYHGLNPSTFSTNLKAISAVSKAKKKPCGVTETGVEGFTAKDYWSTQILAPATGRTVSMIVMWRNKYYAAGENGNHYFSVFKGHASESDFVKMYKNPITFFSKDLPDMYKMAEGVTVE